jgi:cytosine/adenosine deaminase-related metal-dependent hydrolase
VLTLCARWVLPITTPPLEPGWVSLDGGRVVSFGPERRLRPRGGPRELDLGSAALLPGLVNAHTHLELSYLRGAVPPAARFTEWIRDLMRARRREPDPSAAPIVESLVAGIDEARACGTALLGDVSNTLVSVPALAQSRVAARVFYELVRFAESDAEEVWRAASERLKALPPASNVRLSPAPHAPYSVSPALFRLIRRDVDRTPLGRTSVHLCESREECELLEHGTGPWRELLAELNAWDPTWAAPGCSPVEYLDRMRFLAGDTIVVHGVHLADRDLARLAARQTTLVTCPRSNRHVGVGDPPLARFYGAGVRVAVGTDSLASAPDLNVFGELAAMRRLAPDVPASRLLDSATRAGAAALGFAEYGTIAAGVPAASLIAVRAPEGVESIEEFLVSGVGPEQVSWPAPVST